MGRTLADEAGKLLDSAKTLKEAIDRTLRALELNYSDEAIEEEFGFGEADFIKDFTDQFLDDCKSLEDYC